MSAIDPPAENTLATRAALLDYLRLHLAPLFPDLDELDALPAWLWSLPSHRLAKVLGHPPECAARVLAAMLDEETARRHPAERYVALIARLHPLLSAVQRGRLAEFTHAFRAIRVRSGEVTDRDMDRAGFNHSESRRFLARALELLTAEDQVEDQAPTSPRPALEHLREAGNRAHTNRAFADGAIELDAAEAGRGPRAQMPAAGR